MIRVLDQYLTPVCLLKRTVVPDGYGGETEKWQEGETFNAAFFPEASGDARTAEQRGHRRLFTLLAPQTVHFRHNDRIRRLADGLTLRILTDGDDLKTPPGSRLKLCQVQAEAIEP